MAEHRQDHQDTLPVGTADAVPGDDKAHAHSHAAHLQPESSSHTSTVPGGGAGKQGREPGTLREPPQDPRRSGKGHARE